MIRTFVLVSVCAVLVWGRYPGFTVSLPADTIDFDYSADQKYIGVLSESVLRIVSAIEGQLVQQLQFEQPLSPRSFAFNSDSQLLAVGFENGVIQAYTWDQNKYVKSEQDYQDPTNSIINSVCFLGDSSAIVGAVYDSRVVVWEFQGNSSATAEFGSAQAKTVACSPKEQGKFVAGGGQGGEYRLQFFEYADTKISSVNVTTQTGTIVESATYNQDGSSVYLVAGTNLILAYSTVDYSQILRLEPAETAGKTYRKIRITANEQLIAGVVQEQVVLINQNQASNLKTNLVATVQQLLNTTVNSVALASRGEHLFYSSGAGVGQVLNKCERGQYQDQAGACINCAQNCQICESSPDACYQCQPKFYLKDRLCYACSSGCLDCSEQKCNQCGPNFQPPTDFTCICKQGFYKKQDICVACGVGCARCTAQGCLECRPEFDLVDTQCQCKKGTYLDGDTCKPCSRGCLNCDSFDTCNQCDAAAHFILDPDSHSCVCDAANKFVERDGMCVCLDGYYQDSNQCLACALGCELCTAYDECTECKQGLILANGFCICQSTQFVDDQGVCQQCSDTTPYCIACLKANTCQQCEVGSHRNPNSRCGCISGYYEDDSKQCRPCDIKGCLECSNNIECTLCDASNHWEADPATSKCRCMKKYQQIEDVCVQCPVGCLTCDVQGTCLECDAKDKWQSDGQGKCRCIGGWFQQEQTCQQCMPGCLSCSSAEVCNDCDKQADFQNVNGTCKCIASFYIQNRSCLKCRDSLPRCNICQPSPQGPKCSNCDNPFVLVSNNCTCDKGKFVNGTTCSDCPKECAACDSLTKCTACISGYELKDGKCVKKGIDTRTAVLIVGGVVALAIIIFELLR